MTINFAAFVPAFDQLIEERGGLSYGLGRKNGMMCVEAAVCTALDLPFGDDPKCVEAQVRDFKIEMNDSLGWLNPKDRAEGLRNLAIAQVGSKGVVDGVEFVTRLIIKVVNKLLPELFRDINMEGLLKFSSECETVNSIDGVQSLLRNIQGSKVYDNYHFNECLEFICIGCIVLNGMCIATGIKYAHRVYSTLKYPSKSKYLRMGADLAFEVLKELNSPGCDWV